MPVSSPLLCCNWTRRMREQRGATSALSVDLPKGDLGNLLGTLGNVFLWGATYGTFSTLHFLHTYNTHVYLQCCEEESIIKDVL